MDRKFAGLLRAAWLGMALVCAMAVQAQQPVQGDGVKEVRLAPGQFEMGALAPAWVEPFKDLPTSQDKSPLVSLLMDTQLMAGAHPAFYVHHAWTANAVSALNDIGRYSIDFDPSYQRVKFHTLRVVRGGTVLERLAQARVTFLQRERGLEQGVYTGTVSASILLDDLRVGDILEVAYTIEGDNPIIGNKYLQWASWDQSVRVESRRVILSYPADRKIDWRMLGDANREAVQPQESLAGNMRKLRWQAQGLPPAEPEKDLPSDFIAYRYLQFSEFSKWSDVSDWADQLFRTETAPVPEIDNLIAGLKAKPTQDERVSAALTWVQDEIRYFSLALGESSHRPAAPSVTLQRRYGDCKDKSLLLIHVLRGLGIRAQPVLVAARSVRGATKQLPSPFAFDHVIVRAEVDGQIYFLDPTRQGQSGKLATMGQLWEGAEVLVVQAGNNTFTTISSPNFPAISRNELNESIRLPKFDGDGEVIVQQTWSGVHAEVRRMIFAQLPQETLHKALIERYERRYPGILYAAVPKVEDDRANNVLSVAMSLKVPKMAVSSGGSWGLKYGANNFQGALPLPPSVNRRLPFALPPKGRTQYKVEVEFPPNVAVMADPSSQVFHDDAFEFSINKSFRGNRAVTSYDLQMRGRQVEAKHMPTYTATVRRAIDGETGVFIVTKNDIKESGLLGLGTPSLRRTMEARLTESIEKLSKALGDGRLRGDDLAQAYCDRAEALVDLGKAEEGIKDAQLAIKTSPTLARAYACRANVLFGMGEFARAVGDYSKAITLDPEATEVYYRRGHTRFYAGQLRAAADDFAKAGEGKDQEGKLYAELWHVWTLKRLGEQPAEAQVKLASTEPRGEWPRPALAMLHGLISVDEMLALLDQKKGDDKDMALAEAYFYAGQWHYLQGNKDKAADFFEKTREQGAIMYIEHVSAGIELQQLAGGK